MARSAQSYVRGSTARFYEWLRAEGRMLPEGPQVWICGDCHYGNLGPVANSKDEVAVHIRDLDQTVIGNPAHDVIRLALSLASAARGFDLPGATTAAMVEQIVDAYQEALTAERRPDDDQPPTIKGLIHASRHRSWAQLARERIEDLSPQIPLGKSYWPLARDERRALVELVASEPVRDLVTQLQSRPSDAGVELIDAAYWVKGCSSLGLLRYALLVGVGEGKHRELCLIDVKEAVRAAAPRAPRASMPKDNAQRVVEGARALSPSLGDRMRPSRLLDKPVFVRELRPQDLKLELDDLDVREALCVSRFLAGVVGRAHARQMDRPERERWAAELNLNRSKSLDAPSWLWTSVVDLLAQHEAAYLDHCRRHADVAA
jgi:uncharacterized protein (DUF2252 family)